MVPAGVGRLVVYVVWHPGDAGGQESADGVLDLIQGDSARPGAERIGIPVRFRKAMIEGGRVPHAITLEDETRAVVAIVAAQNLLADRDWRL